MMSKEQIHLLCKEENFVQDFLRYESVREQRRQLRVAIDTIEKLTPPKRLETAVDLSPTKATMTRLDKIEKAHAVLLEDAYNWTWHCNDTVISILSKEGRI